MGGGGVATIAAAGVPGSSRRTTVSSDRRRQAGRTYLAATVLNSYTGATRLCRSWTTAGVLCSPLPRPLPWSGTLGRRLRCSRPPPPPPPPPDPLTCRRIGLYSCAPSLFLGSRTGAVLRSSSSPFAPPPSLSSSSVVDAWSWAPPPRRAGVHRAPPPARLRFGASRGGCRGRRRQRAGGARRPLRALLPPHPTWTKASVLTATA